MSRFGSAGCALFAALASSAALALASSASPTAAATRGPALIRAFEAAPALVVGQVLEVDALPHGAHLARVRVERTLRGEAAPGTTLELAWEEPVPSLPARFAPGDRALWALEALPTASIWRTRVPDEARRAGLVTVALGGEAYLARPSQGALDLLSHHLALAPSARRGEAGIVYLTRMAAGGEPRLARAALLQLEASCCTERPVLAPAAQAWIDAVLRHDDPGVAAAALALLERQRPAGVLDFVRARIAIFPPTAVPPALRAAEAALAGGIDASQAQTLLGSSDAENRRTAARFLRGPDAPRTLRQLIARDDSAEVRATALARLVALEGEGALTDAIRGLGDEQVEVRRSAAHAIAPLGPAAVPELAITVETGSTEAARTAIATLSLMGEEAQRLLVKIADGHEDESLRTLAGIAIGRPLGHQH